MVKEMNRHKAIRGLSLLLALLLAAGGLAACTDDKPAGNGQEQSGQTQQQDGQIAPEADKAESEDVVDESYVPVKGEFVKDGVYDIAVDSSSSMFNITSCKLTVAEGSMTAVMTMGGTGYRYIYMGTPQEAAAADESSYIMPEADAQGAHTFTVPVEALDMGIDCAAFSDKKEQWYDRVLVFRASSLKLSDFKEGAFNTAASLGIADGEYTCVVDFSGGSGKSYVESPLKLTVSEGKAVAELVWSSPNYDYMIVGGEKYLPVNSEGNSVFLIPVEAFDFNITVIGDTVAMSTPHEIEYVLNFDSSTISGK